MYLKQFEDFLKTVNLCAYRDKYLPIKIVEMDMPKDVQALNALCNVYWDQKRFISFDEFYLEYKNGCRLPLKIFFKKTQMCSRCFNKGLPARIYRTWASIITQIHAGYVAESVFGEGAVAMSGELDHQGADFQVKYKGKILNYQVKKKSFSGEVRRGKGGVKNKIDGKFVDINYEVPSGDYFENPKKKDGTDKLPYARFMANKELKRFPNGFVVFTPYPFEQKKKEMDNSLK